MSDLLLSRAVGYSGDQRIAEFWMTNASDRNLTPRQDHAELDDAHQSIIAGAWSWVRQVHSDRVVTVTEPGGSAGLTADALVTGVPNAIVAVQVADCVPIGLVSSDGTIGVVHAGWRGALRGVIESAVRAMQAVSAIQVVSANQAVSANPRIEAVVGPHIGVGCYEFGVDDLATMERRFGPSVVGVTRAGTPGLDMTEVVMAELDRLGIPFDVSGVKCTACSGSYWSHRARGESQRQSLVGVIR